jgi:hypothetical protein
MKLIYIECNAEEMRANRTFIDALTDIACSIVDTFHEPMPDTYAEALNEEMEKEEEQE